MSDSSPPQYQSLDAMPRDKTRSEKRLGTKKEWWQEKLRQLESWRNLMVNSGGIQNAAILSFVSLLACVPVMTVVLTVLASFDIGTQDVVNWVLGLIPLQDDEFLAEFLQNSLNRARELTGLNFAMMAVSALVLLVSVERSFHNILAAQRGRNWLQRLIIYWAVVSLLPIVIFSFIKLIGVLGLSFVQIPLPFFSFGTSWGGLFLLYFLLPSQKMSILAVAMGALVGAIMLTFSQIGFEIYAQNIRLYQSIYGALAALLLFLLWLYITWIMILTGLTVTAALQNRGSETKKYITHPNLLHLAVLLIIELQQRENLHDRGLKFSEIAESLGQSEELCHLLLKCLQKKKLIYQQSGKSWKLSRHIDQIILEDVDNALPNIAFLQNPVQDISPLVPLQPLFKEIDNHRKKLLQRKLSEFFTTQTA